MGKIGFRLNENMCVGSEEKSIMKCDFMHALCIGSTGAGKTASLILPTLKDRIKRNHAVISYIYKGHEHQKIKYLAQEANRINDVIEIGKPYGQYINLMAMLDLNMVKKTLEILGGSHNDNFWTLSASRLGTAIVDIMRNIHKISMLLDPIEDETINFRDVSFRVQLSDDDSELVSYTYAKEAPSYRMLAQVTSNPKNLLKFFQGLKHLVKMIEMKIKAISKKQSKKLNETLTNEVLKHLLRLEKSFEGYVDYALDSRGHEMGGNNGVLLVLNNAVAALADKDYINTSEVDVLNLIEKNAILIVDIEGLDADIHGVMLEAMLNKLGRRIRNGIPNAVSVFVDEANRVLPPNVDIHNDVLRESKVELIMAIQNEEQMIEKFSRVKWISIRKNFKHTYKIDMEHKVIYNNKDEWSSEALLIEDDQLNNAEYIYNNLPQNKCVLEERFVMREALPERYCISYDTRSYEHDMAITLTNEYGDEMNMEYIGKEMKAKIKSKRHNLQLDQFHIEMESTLVYK